jgi:HSP20 family protein
MAKREANNKPAKTEHKQSPKSRHLARREPDLGSWLAAPGDLMRRFRNEMDRLFEDFGFSNLARSLPGSDNLGPGLWSPQVEMYEREGKLVIRADLPGLNKDEVKVDLTDDAVAIEGERKREYEESKEGHYSSERTYGHFYRRIPLPKGIDVETANATFRNGVLEITMAAPEAKERKARKLEITDESVPAKAKAAAAGR